MSIPSQSIELLVKIHQEQLEKLTNKLSTFFRQNQGMLSIGWKCMNQLMGKQSPEPCDYKSDSDNH